MIAEIRKLLLSYGNQKSPQSLVSDREPVRCRREWALALKRDFPHLQFSLNGVVQNCQEAASIIGHRQEGVEGGGGLHGVMIGRQAFYQTWDCLADADRTVFGATSNPAISRRQV